MLTSVLARRRIINPNALQRLGVLSRQVCAMGVTWDDYSSGDTCAEDSYEEITSSNGHMSSMMVSWPADESSRAPFQEPIASGMYSTRPFFMLDGDGGRVVSLHVFDSPPTKVEIPCADEHDVFVAPGTWLGHYHAWRQHQL